MKTSELKTILRPIIKEIIKEEILEETGVLSHIITEVLKVSGTQNTKLTESVVPNGSPTSKFFETVRESRKEQSEPQVLEQQKKKLVEGIGKSSYSKLLAGTPYANLFEGTKPLSSAGVPAEIGAEGEKPQGALGGISPDDPGIDIDMFMNPNWAKLAGN